MSSSMVNPVSIGFFITILNFFFLLKVFLMNSWTIFSLEDVCIPRLSVHFEII